MKSSFEELISSSTPVLIDFHAEWCGPCKAMDPVLRALVKEIGDQARIVKIDVDKNQAVSGKYQILAVPTFMIFKNGLPVWRQSGMLSVAQLKSALESFS